MHPSAPAARHDIMRIGSDVSELPARQKSSAQARLKDLIEGASMRIAPLLSMVVVCVVALSDAAMAQGAATGGTQDTGTGSQLFFPIRPRNHRECDP